jgi:hypothetical protein
VRRILDVVEVIVDGVDRRSNPDAKASWLIIGFEVFLSQITQKK